MTNPSKAIGTNCETAVKRLANVSGFPFADRRPLAGSADKGDILMVPGFILEVKGGHAAERASEAQILNWLIETEIERVNAGADRAMLVTKRAGYGAERCRFWNTWLWIDEWLETPGWSAIDEWPMPHIPIRVRLEHAFRLARYAGYGHPIEPEDHDAYRVTA